MKKIIGNYGEDLAAKYLEGKGYEIIARKYYSHYGEIDIVGRDGDQLVFFEVKTRLSTDYGYPEEAITEGKKTKLYETALDYIEKNDIQSDNFRIDSVSILIDKTNKKANISHLINVFDE